MCRTTTDQPQRPTGSRRLKLWDMPARFHCAIIGTCLTLDELRKAARQAGIPVAVGETDYDLHTTMVSLADENNPAARALHKMLERKYKRWVTASRKLISEAEFKQFWAQGILDGEVAGPLWAFMTHPVIGADQLYQAYGDIHMMSHLQGASTRAHVHRVKLLEQALKESRAALQDGREKHHRTLQHKEAQITALLEELATARQSLRETEDKWYQMEQIAAREDPDVQTVRNKLEWVEQKLAEREMALADHSMQLQALKELLEETREERDALENSMAQFLVGGTDSPQTHTDLGGKRIAYVGGRTNLLPHYRALVDASNGLFSHHDGGQENSRASLEYALSGAEVVFCPIDCISHDACMRVKRFCQKNTKSFMPLRTSSISAFSAGLQRVTREVSAP